jgi:titin
LNEKPLPSGSRFTARSDFGRVVLEINSVRESDAGVYVCHASNAFGEARSSAALRVEAGAEAGATLHPSGEAGLKSVEAADARAAAAMAATGVNLDLPEAAEAAEAAMPRPHFAEPLPREMAFSADTGEPLKLRCRVEPRGDARLNLQWYHNGLPLKLGSRATVSLDFGQAELRISGVRAEDAGVYTCRATNAAGSAATFSEVSLASATTSGVDASTLHPRGEEGLRALAEAEKTRAELSIEGIAKAEESQLPTDAPVFAEPFADVAAIEGGSVYCQATLLPKNDATMKVEWKHNGQVLKESARLRTINMFGLAILEVTGLKESEFGSYTCTATNAVGSATCEFTISKAEDATDADKIPRFTSQLKVRP